jgi:hypothetical protein
MNPDGAKKGTNEPILGVTKTREASLTGLKSQSRGSSLAVRAKKSG